MSELIDIIKNGDYLFHGKPATYKEVIEAEQQLRIKFSRDYCEYLKTYGTATFDGHELTGITEDKRKNVVCVTEKNRNDNNRGLYVIEETNIDGIVIWQASSGEIFESRYNGILNKLCDNLCEYFAGDL